MKVIGFQEYLERKRRAQEGAVYRAIQDEQERFQAAWENMRRLPPARIVQLFQKSLKHGLLHLQDINRKFD
ncbi:hypothetical protein SAMN02746041_01583 [Desulfacinum hydrothermale DSM 13146]|uniref:Uncharacterized protein n=1 Tax=Desulfacinum hydrothermale DSM 13146 TaxID=1121390 RepID=A0A1W1XFW8_9BACT|nr:hypothetical protein [Desulfacinum hydrothermale]SMC22886.1 hypothetical protein SAMN02746041_01583 [Desulfacinum hydrothermale DSM 13146]